MSLIYFIADKIQIQVQKATFFRVYRWVEGYWGIEGDEDPGEKVAEAQICCFASESSTQDGSKSRYI